MKGKKILSWLLTLALIVSFVPAMFAAEYPDTKGHWAEAPIERWSEYGIVTGDERGFRPNDYMTRAEAATVLAKLFKLQDSAARTAFSDVKADQWYYDAINKCVNAGILNGVGDNKFAPMADLTREQLVTILQRYANYKGIDTSEGEMKPLKDFDDTRHISDWAVKAFRWAVDAGIINGTGNGKISPKTDASRAQVATMLMRYDSITQ